MDIAASYRKPLYIAIGIHLLLIIALMWHVAHQHYGDGAPKTTFHIVQAQAVSVQKIDHALNVYHHHQRQIHEQKLAKIRAHKRHLHWLAMQRAHAKHQALVKRERHFQALKQQKALQLKKQKLAKKQKALQHKLLAEQLKADMQNVANAKQTAMAGIINQYKSKIIKAISQQWLVPQNTRKGVYCQLLIHLAPGGVVLSVKLLKSSGNPVLDRSARTAVFKASPLPVPKDPSIFSNFRTLNLKVVTS